MIKKFAIALAVVGTVALSSCTSVDRFWRGDHNAFSAVIEHKNDTTYVVSRTLLTGTEHLDKIGSISLDLLFVEEEISLGFEHPVARNPTVSKALRRCAIGEKGPEFDAAAKQMSGYLSRFSHFHGSDFRFVVVPPDTSVRYTARQVLSDRVPLRFVLPAPQSVVDCRRWWSYALGIGFHELTHILLETRDLLPPNRFSEEVVAYSVMRCAQLLVASPGEIGFTNFSGYKVTDEFSSIYDSLLISLDSSDSSVPLVLADLHIYEILDRHLANARPGYSSEALQQYCAEIPYTQIDFLKSSFFDIQGHAPERQ